MIGSAKFSIPLCAALAAALALTGCGKPKEPAPPVAGVQSDAKAPVMHSSHGATTGLSLVPEGDGRHLVGTLDGNLDQWIAIQYDFPPDKLPPKARLRAHVAVKELDHGGLCLGIYDGAKNVCSATISKVGDYDLTVDATLVDPTKSQFKVNLFPAPGTVGKIDASISGMALEAR